MHKKLLTNGNIFKRTDACWNGVVWYMDEKGERKRKSFSGTSKAEVKEKITEYIAVFNEQLTASDESKAKLEDRMNGRRCLTTAQKPAIGKQKTGYHYKIINSSDSVPI